MCRDPAGQAVVYTHTTGSLGNPVERRAEGTIPHRPEIKYLQRMSVKHPCAAWQNWLKEELRNRDLNPSWRHRRDNGYLLLGMRGSSKWKKRCVDPPPPPPGGVGVGSAQRLSPGGKTIQTGDCPHKGKKKARVSVVGGVDAGIKTMCSKQATVHLASHWWASSNECKWSVSRVIPKSGLATGLNFLGSYWGPSFQDIHVYTRTIWPYTVKR